MIDEPQYATRLEPLVRQAGLAGELAGQHQRETRREADKGTESKGIEQTHNPNMTVFQNRYLIAQWKAHGTEIIHAEGNTHTDERDHNRQKQCMPN